MQIVTIACPIEELVGLQDDEQIGGPDDGIGDGAHDEQKERAKKDASRQDTPDPTIVGVFGQREIKAPTSKISHERQRPSDGVENARQKQRK